MEWYWSAFTGLLGVLGGVVGSRLVGNYLALRSGNYSIDKQQRRDVLDEYRELIDTLQREHKELREELERRLSTAEENARKHADCEVRCARAEARIEALEDALTHAGIKHRPWVRPAGDSAVHRPLPPE